MLSALILAVTLKWSDGWRIPYEDAVPATNVVRKLEKQKRPEPKPRDKLNPVEAWHNFCRPDGKVEIQKDTRPKPYKREKPNPHKRKPRK